MTHSPSTQGAPTRLGLFRTTFAPAVLCAAAALAWYAAVDQPASLEARGSGPDTDRDGLVDLQEHVLGTNPSSQDSDRDGFSDTSEIARGTGPLNPASYPGADVPSVNMLARSENDMVTVVSAIYLSNHEIGDIDFEFGVVLNGRPVALDRRRYQGASRYSLVRVQGDRLLIMETTFPVLLVSRLGQLSLYSGLRQNGVLNQASALTVAEVGGVPVVMEFLTGNHADMNDVGPQPMQRGLIYRPLVPRGDLGSSWDEGFVCFQSLSSVGSNGASSVSEVESAGCEPLDSSCMPDACSASVGSTREVVDPLLLLGG